MRRITWRTASPSGQSSSSPSATARTPAATVDTRLPDPLTTPAWPTPLTTGSPTGSPVEHRRRQGLLQPGEEVVDGERVAERVVVVELGGRRLEQLDVVV